MKGTRSIAFLPAALGLAVASCRSAPEPAAVPEALPPPPVVTALEVKRPFAPPADGRLDPKQVEMYLAVKRRAAALVADEMPGGKPAPAAKADPAAVVAQAGAEVRAAELLGYEPAEYRWVRDRVAEASVGTAAEGLAGVAALVETGALESRGKLVSKVASPEAKEPGSPGPGDPAAREWNRKVLKAFRDDRGSPTPSVPSAVTTPPSR